MTITATTTGRLEQFECFGTIVTIRAEGSESALLPAIADARAIAFDIQSGSSAGLAADLMSAALAELDAWVIDCGGDVRVGGTTAVPRRIHVLDPVDRTQVLHELTLSRGAVVTSTGHAADTGVVQATAVAPTGLEAEILAESAILAGPADAAHALPHGGVAVFADGIVEIVPLTTRSLAGRSGARVRTR